MSKQYEINQHIRQAFFWLDMINLSGEAVEMMAMARRELRVAQSICPEDAPEVADD